jgi:hypothetical protein
LARVNEVEMAVRRDSSPAGSSCPSSQHQFQYPCVAQEAEREKVTVNGEAEILSPPFLTSEDALKKWVEDIIRDAPPAGGMVTMLKHWPPKYAHNERVGKIWILPAVVAIEMHGYREHEMVFLVYHVENRQGEIRVAWGIPDKALPLYLGGMSEI